MRRNNIMAFLFSILLLLSAFPANIAAAQPPAVVYTEFVSGNFNHAGDGTPASPYNLFEDAMAAVADGGTIYILGGGAFINVTKGNPPFQITKNVTISSAPGMSAQSNLYTRTAGIVLGANVTFDNIELSFANGFRPVICANGYTLTLNNVSYSTHTRVIHLAGGGLFYADGTSASPAAGPHSRIVVTGKDSSFGNIYAGSINGSFDKAVDITVENVAGRNIGAVYAGGAAEGYYNSENFFDINNEPEPPKVNPAAYPVRGKVSVSLNHTGISTVNGATGGTENASVSVWTQHLYSCALSKRPLSGSKRRCFCPHRHGKWR